MLGRFGNTPSCGKRVCKVTIVQVAILLTVTVVLAAVVQLSKREVHAWDFLDNLYGNHQAYNQSRTCEVPHNLSCCGAVANTSTTTYAKNTTLDVKQPAKVGKVTILYGAAKPVYERALRTHEVHDKIHGYPLFIQREPILDGYWTKPAHIQAVVLGELEKPREQRLEWLFWVDADTVMLNYETPLEAFLPPTEAESPLDIHVLVTEDWNGLNNGVFAIRVSSYAVELFAAILAFRDFRQDVSLKFEDQSAMENVLQQRKFAKHKIVVPQRWFNGYKSNVGEELHEDQVRPGDLLVHFAGVNNREAHMTKWCELSEHKDPLWNEPILGSEREFEIRAFWEDLKMKTNNIQQFWAESKAKLRHAHDIATRLLQGYSRGGKWDELRAVHELGQKLLGVEGDVPVTDLSFDDVQTLDSMTSRMEKACKDVIGPSV